MAALVFLPIAAHASEAPRPVQMIALSCMEALVSIGSQELAGIFTFISEKDGPAAFADLLVHNTKSLRKFASKVQRDLKSASGISAWDRDALQYAIGIYESPLGATLEHPGKALLVEIRRLAAAPVVSLEQISEGRRKG